MSILTKHLAQLHPIHSPVWGYFQKKKKATKNGVAFLNGIACRLSEANNHILLVEKSSRLQRLLKGEEITDGSQNNSVNIPKPCRLGKFLSRASSLTGLCILLNCDGEDPCRFACNPGKFIIVLRWHGHPCTTYRRQPRQWQIHFCSNSQLAQCLQAERVPAKGTGNL